MKNGLNEFVVSADRWTNRAISPLNFKSKTDRAKHTVIIHPGWGKRPEMLRKLLFALADTDTIMPIGVDTRFGYSDRQQNTGYRLGAGATKLFRQAYKASAINPFFEPQSVHENRYRLRRPTGLAALCVELRIEQASLFGHSEGGRITTTLAGESDVLIVPKLVVANAVGTGDNSSGTRRMWRSNTRTNYVADGTVDLAQGVLSAAESTAYALTHARRFRGELEVIQEANIWPLLGVIARRGTQVTVMHAMNDQLVEFADSARKAELHPGVKFIPTEGGHSNVYTDAVTAQIVAALAA